MIGLLYESDEWSDWKLRDELEVALGEPVAMIDMEDEGAVAKACECELLISRVFASAAFRGHARSLENMEALIENTSVPPMINPPRAHAFETSKHAATRELARSGFDVPAIQALGRPSRLIKGVDAWSYPCIIKPDRGGRTTHTRLLRSNDDAREFLESAPEIDFVVEDFIESRGGFITRIELVNGHIALIVKRSVEQNGLSSYHEGSAYAPYPDCPDPVKTAALEAGSLLDIRFGSFDIIESADGSAYIIDANSVSNVSEDCTEMLGMDLMREHAIAMGALIREAQQGKEPSC